MSIKKSIAAIAMASALMDVGTPTTTRKYQKPIGLTPKQWEARKKRLKIQKKSRKVNRAK